MSILHKQDALNEGMSLPCQRNVFALSEECPRSGASIVLFIYAVANLCNMFIQSKPGAGDSSDQTCSCAKHLRLSAPWGGEPTEGPPYITALSY